MKRSTHTITGSLLLGAAVSLSGACGSGSEEGNYDSFLTIVGDRSVFLESGDQAELQVRYHDRAGEALHGSVEFVIEGEPSGAYLANAATTTSSEGIASVTIDANNNAQTTFTVRASAADAGSVSWEVTLAEPSIPLDPNGTYAMNSSFDIISGLEEGTVRDVVHGVRDFTQDPGTFLLRLAIEACGSTCSLFSGLVDSVGPALTVFLRNLAPDFVDDLLDLGQEFFQIAHNFQIVSELQVTGDSANHVTTGIIVASAAGEQLFTMAEMGVEPVAAESVTFSIVNNDRDVEIGEHSLPMAYGAMLKIAIEQVLIPSVDGAPGTLASFLHNRIDCGPVGQFLEDNIPGLPVTVLGFVVYDGFDLCVDGINAGSNAIMNRLENLDATGLELVIGGTAQPVSHNSDGTLNVLRNGRWQGNMNYGTAVAATLEGLANNFRAERIGN
jgi:hypothetical protein